MSASPVMVMETDEHVPVVEEDEVEEQQEEDLEAEAEAEADEEGGDEEDEEDENPQGEDQPGAESAPARKKRTKKEPVALVREPGKSYLPFSRVQKIIKADKDIPIVARDAVFLVALATESFITELAAAAQRVAEKERRTTVQHKDIATVVRKADEFMFLEDIIPWTASSSEPKRSKPTGPKAVMKSSVPTLDKYIMAEGGMGVVMNEDGTMDAVGDTNDD